MLVLQLFPFNVDTFFPWIWRSLFICCGFIECHGRFHIINPTSPNDTTSPTFVFVPKRWPKTLCDNRHEIFNLKRCLQLHSQQMDDLSKWYSASGFKGRPMPNPLAPLLAPTHFRIASTWPLTDFLLWCLRCWRHLTALYHPMMMTCFPLWHSLAACHPMMC